MKRITIVLSVLFIIIACNNQEKTASESTVKYSDLKLEKVMGDVSTIQEMPYTPDSTGKIGEMDTCCASVSEYDANGNNIRYTTKDHKDVVKEEWINARYENGLWKSNKGTKDGRVSGSFETEMDDKANYTLAKQYDSTGKLEYYYTGLTQNDAGQVLTWKQYDKDSVFRAEAALTYENYQQTGFTMKDSVGKLKSESIMKYNEKGEQTEYISKNVTKDSTTTKVVKYTYDSHDEKGNWTQRTEYDEKGKAVKVVKRVLNYRKEEAKK